MITNNYQTYLNNKKYFYSLDPGCRTNGGTGVSKFELPFLPVGKSKLLEVKLFDSPLDDWNKSSNLICLNLDYYFQNENDNSNTPVFIEKPQFFENHKGMTAARSSSLEKLITLYGRIYQIICQNNFRPIPVAITDWKKGMTKDIVLKRFMRKFIEIGSKVDLTAYDGKKINSDEMDALCIGLYILGAF